MIRIDIEIKETSVDETNTYWERDNIKRVYFLGIPIWKRNYVSRIKNLTKEDDTKQISY